MIDNAKFIICLLFLVKACIIMLVNILKDTVKGFNYHYLNLPFF